MTTTRPTLRLYLARLYTVNVAAFFFALIVVMGLFDAIESLRILSKAHAADVGTVLYLVILKAPGNILKIAPFVMLFSAMMVLGGLQRRQELVVMRVSGASLWQVLSPFFMVSFLYGVLLSGAIQPMSIVTDRLYDQYESQALNKGENTVSLLDHGLWLRQTRAENGGSYILRAERVTLPDWTLSNVMVLTFGADHQFIARLDGDRADLANGYWNVMVPDLSSSTSDPSSSTRQGMVYRFSTTLTRADLDQQFLSANTASFWAMPRFIQTLAQTGFPTLPVQVQFGSLLALPFLCIGLVMVAAVVSVRVLVRSGGATRQVLAGIVIGFFIFFLNNFLMALGGGGQIPVWLAVSAPALLTGAGGAIALLSIEDR